MSQNTSEGWVHVTHILGLLMIQLWCCFSRV